MGEPAVRPWVPFVRFASDRARVYSVGPGIEQLNERTDSAVLSPHLFLPPSDKVGHTRTPRSSRTPGMSEGAGTVAA